ncbi:DUF4954 family protein [Alkalispirochaeta americana]|uniref:DUF4954 family protein n=1 Tax=Alkalispirochaeta americana TaxID=159291 RepID=UPI001F22D03D|nr:DUF4954 family protein [Alkalispirochaeta americana]
MKITERTAMRQGFVPGDEYALRNTQVQPPPGGWRNLTSQEVERLVKNNNYAENWDTLLVADPFDAGQIRNNRFFGLVRLGAVRDVVLEYHDLLLPAGISNSLIISCDIGNDAALHNVSYIAHYIVGDRTILFNLDEVHTTNYAKFGNGIVKDGEAEDVRIWLEVMNEGGDRKILPFDGMLSADAYLWARYRDDRALQQRLVEITQKSFDSRRGYYGTIGNGSVIKNSRILKDVKVGDGCYIKGANKLKNLTINSSLQEPSQIGEGVELVNGIIGYGCSVFYGCKAVRFILGNNSGLKYGARLINSFLGDNSTISCCEVLNNLIFPAHEQHHNNSFLVAAVVKGQSNIAAGATLGSNHNSRANDNEIEAGRGFWPGLATSLKHSSRFASFVLLAKADYPAELNIPFPFALVSNNVSRDRLEIAPAFWWRHNMYALQRNGWKVRHRDRRLSPGQAIEFDVLAPDTTEEICQALTILEPWKDAEGPVEISREGLSGESFGYERSRRPVVVHNPAGACQAYREMLVTYAVTTLLPLAEELLQQGLPRGGVPEALDAAAEGAAREWVNLGGQLVPEDEVKRLRQDIGQGILADWDSIHQRYQDLWNRYEAQKRSHAAELLRFWGGQERIDEPLWARACREAIALQEMIAERVYLSRQKDDLNPFRRATYRCAEEMYAVVGSAGENSFVLQVQADTKELARRIAGVG